MLANVFQTLLVFFSRRKLNRLRLGRRRGNGRSFADLGEERWLRVKHLSQGFNLRGNLGKDLHGITLLFSRRGLGQRSLRTIEQFAEFEGIGGLI